MAKSPQKPKTNKGKPPEVELEPGAWERFERLITRAGKTPPKRHEESAKPKKGGARGQRAPRKS